MKKYILILLIASLSFLNGCSSVEKNETFSFLDLSSLFNSKTESHDTSIIKSNSCIIVSASTNEEGYLIIPINCVKDAFKFITDPLVKPFVKTGTPSESYILLIAIDNYKYWSKLNNAVNDARKIREILTQKYQFNPKNVFEIYNEDATKAGMFEALENLCETINENDNIIIYFSGHGAYNPILDEGYWIPVDACRNSYIDYFDNSTIIKFIKNIKSKHTFLVADACFAGSLFFNAKGNTSYADKVGNYASRWGLTSGRNETVEDGIQGQNSPFARSILSFLKQQEKSFPVSELIQYVKTVVARNSKQTPIGNPLKNVGDEGGELVFKNINSQKK